MKLNAVTASATGVAMALLISCAWGVRSPAHHINVPVVTHVAAPVIRESVIAFCMLGDLVDIGVSDFDFKHASNLN